VELLVGKQGVRERRGALERIQTGATDLVVGTHALIQEGVEFAQLGFVIIDEQHRFGVLQRKALRDKGAGIPDVLVMTATPIPRTLTMTSYGDLDVSKIDELPPGRQPIKTYCKPPEGRAGVYDGVRKIVERGQQAYFVCPLVGETEKVQALAATELYTYLSTEIFPEFRVGLLHGQMKPAEKESAMEAFRTHETDILVSTTVIEVGVDVPNASVMVIEDADRFGLSQLHQLRGRVGRGSNASFCVLVGAKKTDETSRRLDAMEATNDGFKIAEIDLELRGPGNMAGTEQSGRLDFRIADLVLDAEMLERARAVAKDLVMKGTIHTPEWAGVLASLRQSRGELSLVTVS
ncbi:MAG: DNA helicase RecG, partial [Armatimonadota bacterium]